MRYAVLALVLAACGGGGDPAASSGTATASAATPAPAPAAAPAAEVGPDGPADLALPALAVGADADAAGRGKGVFDAKGCGGCHAFGSVLVGPDLAGIGERRTDAWIAKMILHPDAMTKQDPVAKELMKKHMLQMPNQGVADAEIGDLIAYIKAGH